MRYRTALAPLVLLILLAVSIYVFAQRDSFDPQRVIDPLPPITEFDIKKAEEVADQLSPEEFVIGVVVDGQPRAYPINMLTGPQREIINDELGGTAIAATW